MKATLLVSITTRVGIITAGSTVTIQRIITDRWGEQSFVVTADDAPSAGEFALFGEDLRTLNVHLEGTAR